MARTLGSSMSYCWNVFSHVNTCSRDTSMIFDFSNSSCSSNADCFSSSSKSRLFVDAVIMPCSIAAMIFLIDTCTVARSDSSSAAQLLSRWNSAYFIVASAIHSMVSSFRINVLIAFATCFSSTSRRTFRFLQACSYLRLLQA